jgi:uncharacterized membrane protein YfcA
MEWSASEVLLLVPALAAGVMNAVAGGGTLLTFPALTSVLHSGVGANATSTVALVPGSLGGAWGYRKELRACGRWLRLLTLPSLVGGVIGSLLVTRLDPKVFDMLVPWLIFMAAVLFLSQPWIGHMAGIGKQHGPPSRPMVVGVVGFQFLVAVYGGYFGAGIGILMLAALSLMGLSDIHHMNAVKTLLAVCINGVSVLVFALEGKVVWSYALFMAIAASAGGYLGARIARRLNRELVRWIVILIGFGLAAYYFFQQWQFGT